MLRSFLPIPLLTPACDVQDVDTVWKQAVWEFEGVGHACNHSSLARGENKFFDIEAGGVMSLLRLPSCYFGLANQCGVLLLYAAAFDPFLKSGRVSLRNAIQRFRSR